MIELIDPESEKVVFYTRESSTGSFTVYHYPATDEFQMETVTNLDDGTVGIDYSDVLSRDEFTKVVRLFLAE